MVEKPLFSKTCVLEKIQEKGGWTYVLIKGIVGDPHKPFRYLRVKGNIDDFPIVQYNLMPMGEGVLFLPIKAEIRKKINKDVGDKVKVVLYLDDSPLQIPDDVQLCLNDDAAIKYRFEKLSPSHKKEYIDYINEAKKIETRVNRIAKMIEKLSEK